MNLAGNVREAMTGVQFSDPSTPTHWGPETGEASVSAYDDLDDFDGELAVEALLLARLPPLGHHALDDLGHLMLKVEGAARVQWGKLTDDELTQVVSEREDGIPEQVIEARCMS